MEGEDEEAPPAYSSTPISPTHTHDGGDSGAGGGGVGTRVASADTRSKRSVHSNSDNSNGNADGLMTFLKTLMTWLRSVGGLIVLLLAYTFFGAWVMMTVEGPAEIQQMQKVYNVRESIAEELKNNTLALRAGRLNDTEWETRADTLLIRLETTVNSAGVASISKKKWTFFGAVLFCFTTYTTIGYGDIAPATKAGRVATMLYATIGIPLALIVLADLGRRFTVGLKFFWGFIRRYYYTGYCRQVRHKVDKTFYDMNEANVGVTDSGHGLDLQLNGIYTTTGGGGAGGAGPGSAVYKEEAGRAGKAGVEKITAAGEPGGMALVKEAEKAEVSSLVSLRRKDVVDPVRRSQSVERTSLANSKTSSVQDCRLSVRRSVSPKKDSVFIDQEDLSEDFKLPVLVAVGFIFAYIFGGACMYILWEDWTYLESFYFVFITTSTIGFGDVLPEHPNFFLLSCVYTFLGLALVSMTINVIMEWLTKTIDRAKEKVDQAREKAMAKAKEATGKLSEVGSKAKSKVLNTVGREGSASPQLKGRGEEDGEEEEVTRDEEPVQLIGSSERGALQSHGHVDRDPSPVTEAGHRAASQSPAQIDVTTHQHTSPPRLHLSGQGGSDLDLPTPSSDNESSFRTANDFTASSDSISEQLDRK
ncbi:uncharacterized protein LOC143300169 [Babylonia areolata]|uniref:uncharacterized protein LOC143300169 n=1 Tax=Babylonia areolata TaxID=304850 RepID=UPI003FD24ED6